MKQKSSKAPKLADTLGSSLDVKQFSCFVPRTVLEAIADKRIRYTDDFNVVVEKFTAAVVFCDASGFTALTEALDTQPNGAERLGGIINQFFDKIIRIVDFWGGDIIKFSGDALTIVWPVDDEDNPASGGGESGLSSEDEYRIDSHQACLMAAKCCMNLHRSLHRYPTGFAGKTLTLHIGAGFGKVTILQVGGIMDRWEYVVAGAPLEEIAIAEPLASVGETVVSPTMATALRDVAALEPVKESPPGRQFFRLLPVADDLVEIAKDSGETEQELESPSREPAERERLEELRKAAEWHVEPPPRLATIEIDAKDLDLLRRYIPPAVFRRLTSGCNVFLNELRTVSVMFICVRGLDVSSQSGSTVAHKLMKMTQRAVYTMEGSVNKFLVDDKGVLLLVMFGLPPVYHLDDPVRAVMAGLRVIDGMKVLGLDAGIGITSGRVWCGTVGNDLRKEYTALGDFVNLAARLMAKAGPREIYVDANTYRDAKHALEFKPLASMMVKGKENPIEVYMPNGTVINAVNAEPELRPLLSWPGWPCKNELQKIVEPSMAYKQQQQPVRPPLDYDVPCGPLFAHEWYEPYLPQLQPLLEVGGVMVIKGREGLGSKELAGLLAEFGRRTRKSHMFFISNMPDSPNLNIGNVPLLAWRKLCTEMVDRWRVSDNREKKGYSRINRDNSVYGITKELIGPSFHWHLEEMKPVVHGLVLPQELPGNQRRARERRKNLKRLKQVGYEPMSPTLALLRRPAEWVEEAGRRMGFRSAEAEDRDNSSESEGSGLGFKVRPSGEFIAPMIASLVSGFSRYERSIVVLHVRTGTSVFAEMDRDSWQVARWVGHVSSMRRLHRLDYDMQKLKEWRCTHSRECWWCKGYRTRTVKDSSGKIHEVQPTQLCKPPASEFHQPLVFVLICSDTTDNVPEQQQLVKMAEENNAYIELRKLTEDETAGFLAHCLQIKRKYLDPEFVHYVHRVSAGVPKYVFLTAKNLVSEGHVVLKEQPQGETADPPLLREDTQNFEARYRFLLRQRLGKLYEYSGSQTSTGTTGSESARLEEGIRVAREKEGRLTQRGSVDSSDEDDEEVRFVDDEVIGAVIRMLKQLNQQRAALGLETDEVLDSVKVDKTDEERWQDLAQYDTLSPEVRPPDAVAFDLMPPPASLLSPVFIASESNATGEAERRPFYLAESYRRRLLNWENPQESCIECSGKASESTFDDSKGLLTLHAGTALCPRLRSKHQGGGSSFSGSLCGLEKPRGRISIQEQLAIEDERRIRGGKLTDAEFALLCFRPCWMPASPEDVKALRKSRRRRVAEARGLEWDSDADAFVYRPQNAAVGGASEPVDRLVKRNCGMQVRSDLYTLPFVPQLVATCMFTVERLEPEQQMMAKVASVFPVAFKPTELRAAYPRRMLSNAFYALVEQLVQNDVLETCPPPSPEEEAALRLFTCGGVGKTSTTEAAGEDHETKKMPISPVEVVVVNSDRSGTANEQQGQGDSLIHSRKGSSDATVLTPGNSATGPSASRNSSLALENRPFPGLGPGHERRPSVLRGGGVVTPAAVAGGTLEPTEHSSKTEQGTSFGLHGDSPVSSETVGMRPCSGVSRNAVQCWLDDLNEGRASGATWPEVLSFDGDKETHLRFTSLALQQVVSDLLLIDERKWLTLVCRRALAPRFGPATPQRQVHGDEAQTDVPESLLRDVKHDSKSCSLNPDSVAGEESAGRLKATDGHVKENDTFREEATGN